MADNKKTPKTPLGTLEDEISKLREDVRELNDAILSLDHAKTSLVVSYRKKVARLEKLNAYKKEVESRGGVISNFRDRKLGYLNEDINNVEKNLQGLNNSSKNPLIRLSAGMKEKKLKSLNRKKTSIEETRRIVSNIKVSLSLLKLKYQSNKEGRKIGMESAAQMHLEDIHSEKEKLSQIPDMDIGAIREVKLYTRSGAAILNSYAKFGLVTARCAILKGKDIVVEGVKKVPKKIVEGIKGAIHSDGGRTM